MLGYQCPDCGGQMHTAANLSGPPVHEARCYDCGVLYRRRETRSALRPLPRDYERIGKESPGVHR